MTSASAPGKVILLGEHAVVYGRPAIAVPVTQARVTVEVSDGADDGVYIESAATSDAFWLHESSETNPLARAVSLTLDALEVKSSPPLSIRIRSELPIAAGLGSGAAVSVAIIRALSKHLGMDLPAERQSQLAFEVEKLHHGTPSGIDNTVIAFGRPVRFQKGSPPSVCEVARPFTLLIGDTGIPSPTGQAVAGVRARWEQEGARYEQLFDQIGSLAEQAHAAIAAGRTGQLGPLLDRNQSLLEEIEVSHPKLEALVRAARAAGAQGAKLSGGGGGGNMIALVSEADKRKVARALERAGAVRVLITEVGR